MGQSDSARFSFNRSGPGIQPDTTARTPPQRTVKGSRPDLQHEMRPTVFGALHYAPAEIMTLCAGILNRTQPGHAHQTQIAVPDISLAHTPLITVVKMVDFGYTLPPAISENTVCAAPPPQQFKATPPGNLTREHRTGPCSSLPASLRPQGSLNRIGSRVAASPAGVALQAPVSTAPEPHPSTSTRASPVSSRVR